MSWGFLLLLAAPSPARADWFARVWQSDQGLPNNTVTGIAQTPDGYLWLATPSGLTSFDGIKFRQFSLMEIAGQNNRGILAMTPDHKDGLVLAMDRGSIICLQAGTTRVLRVGVDLPDRVPQSVIEDGEGAIWIAYRGGEVWRIPGAKTAPVNETEGFPPGSAIPAFAVDRRGTLWFAKGSELGVFRNGKYQALLQLDHAPTCIAPARDGGLWICVGQHVFKRYEGGRLEDDGFFKSARAAATPTVLQEDRTGALWIGTSSSGLFRLADSHFEEIKTSHCQILSLMEDSEGNIWVGTGGGGVNLMCSRTIELKGAETGPPEAAQSICEDQNGGLWATTQSGLLMQWTLDKWMPIAVGNGWPGEATCMVADRSGALWVGTQHHGLFCRRGGQFVSWTGSKGLQGHTVHALLADKNDDLWIGEESPNAFQRLHDGKLQNFILPQDIRQIRALAQDAAGNIWIGTSKGALLRVDGDKIEDATKRLFGGPLSIRYLYATPDGSVWAGFAGWGLGRLKNGKFFRISSAEGLFDDYISQIISDDQGCLWFGSNHGIFKIRQRELDDLADGRLTHVQSVYYGAGQGLPSLQANFGNSPGALRSRDGRLWIPTRSGVVAINPDSSINNQSPPRAVVNRVALDDRILGEYTGIMPPDKDQGNTVQWPPEAPVKLSPYFHRLELDYGALTFVTPENVQFRHRLEGVDKDWVEAGTQRSVVYARLPAGNYTFEVIASAGDGVWSKKACRFNFIVPPFFWETWIFRVLSLAAFTFGVALIVRYLSFRRLQFQLQLARHQAALHKERARIAKDIHDDLGADLTQITLLSELARQDCGVPAKTEEHTDKISSTARQAIKSLEEIVWAVNPRNDTLAQLMEYTGQFALDYLASAGIRCRLDFPDTLPEREAPSDVRHNLFLVVKEAINNIVKHAQADQTWLRLSATEEFLQIEIEDNGRGLAPEPDSAGADGLGNMRQRMKEIGGHCHIESQAGSGTRISVVLPWRHAGDRRLAKPPGH